MPKNDNFHPDLDQSIRWAMLNVKINDQVHTAILEELVFIEQKFNLLQKIIKPTSHQQHFPQFHFSSIDITKPLNTTFSKETLTIFHHNFLFNHQNYLQIHHVPTKK